MNEGITVWREIAREHLERCGVAGGWTLWNVCRDEEDRELNGPDGHINMDDLEEYLEDELEEHACTDRDLEYATLGEWWGRRGTRMAADDFLENLWFPNLFVKCVDDEGVLKQPFNIIEDVGELYQILAACPTGWAADELDDPSWDDEPIAFVDVNWLKEGF